MGFMDELKRLSQPFDDDDDFYEDAVEEESSNSGAEKSAQDNSKTKKSAQDEFEDSFASDRSSPEPVRKKKPKQGKLSGGAGGSIFGNFGESQQRKQQFQQEAQRQQAAQRQAQQRNQRRQGFPDQQVVLFNPKDFDEAGELVTYLLQGRSLVMALEGIPTETARRLLDFISGICFALNAKITPVSAKTYFITPENVDLLDATTLQKNNSSGQDDF